MVGVRFIHKEIKFLTAITDLALFMLHLVFSNSLHHCCCQTNSTVFFSITVIKSKAVLSVIETRRILRALHWLVASTKLNDQLYLYQEGLILSCFKWPESSTHKETPEWVRGTPDRILSRSVFNHWQERHRESSYSKKLVKEQQGQPVNLDCKHHLEDKTMETASVTQVLQCEIAGQSTTVQLLELQLTFFRQTSFLLGVSTGEILQTGPIGL